MKVVQGAMLIGCYWTVAASPVENFFKLRRSSFLSSVHTFYSLTGFQTQNRNDVKIKIVRLDLGGVFDSALCSPYLGRLDRELGSRIL